MQRGCRNGVLMGSCIDFAACVMARSSGSMVFGVPAYNGKIVFNHVTTCTARLSLDRGLASCLAACVHTAQGWVCSRDVGEAAAGCNHATRLAAAGSARLVLLVFVFL